MNSDINANSNSETQSTRRAVIEEAITNGAIRYIDGCEGRVNEFVQRHYSFAGALRIHAHAIGWDLVRVPVNIVWSLVNIILVLVAFLAKLLRLRKLYDLIKKLPPGLETDMDRQISWLVITELLKLPHKQGAKCSNKDALMEEIMKDPALRQLLDEELEAFDGISDAPDFRSRLDKKLSEYGATRTGMADLASNASLLISSKAALGQASFGGLSAGSAVSASIAHSVAVSNFWLGSTIGSYYYAVVPVAVSMRLLIAVTAVVAIILAVASTFIGIFTDPVQAKLGLHQKRLKKLIHAIRDDLHGKAGKDFELREKYIGRLFDVADFMSAFGRSL